MSITKAFTVFATGASRFAGRAWTFVLCIALVLVWALTGPVFGFSDTWQLIINTATTVVTFLMVFIIQNTQNRDNAALQAKLDELIRISAAENRFIGIERLSDKELEGILHEVEENAEHIADTGATSTTAAHAHQRSRAARKAARTRSASAKAKAKTKAQTKTRS